MLATAAGVGQQSVALSASAASILRFGSQPQAPSKDLRLATARPSAWTSAAPTKHTNSSNTSGLCCWHWIALMPMFMSSLCKSQCSEHMVTKNYSWSGVCRCLHSHDRGWCQGSTSSAVQRFEVQIAPAQRHSQVRRLSLNCPLACLSCDT